jgi:ribosomal protein S27E
VSGYRFGVTCKRCGGDVIHLTGGTVVAEPRNATQKPYVMVSQVVVRCEPCSKEYVLRMVMEDGPILAESEKSRAYRARRKQGATA